MIRDEMSAEGRSGESTVEVRRHVACLVGVAEEDVLWRLSRRNVARLRELAYDFLFDGSGAPLLMPKKRAPKELRDLESADAAADAAAYAIIEERHAQVNSVKMNAVVRCKKCRSDNISVTEKQTRSADEAATLFYTCHSCMATWRVG